MLIEVHYGNASVLLVNGNCQPVHLLEYIRTRCCVPTSLKIDLCLISSGEPFYISTPDSKLVSSERLRFPSHIRCVLTQIDDEGTYIPLLNDSAVITNDFLAKLKRATATKITPKINVRGRRHSIYNADDEMKRRRSLKSVVIVASAMNKNSP